jgi:hypothetical protein
LGKRLKNTRLYLWGNANTGVPHGASNLDFLLGPFEKRDMNRHFALVRKFDCVADAIHQDLPQSNRVTPHTLWHRLIDGADEFKPFAMGALSL